MYRIGQEEINELARAIEEGALFKVNNKNQRAIAAEERMKELFASAYPIFMTSGHAALVTAITALGIGPGDQVIVPAYTYIATAMAVLEAGAIPVLAEVDETLTLDPADFEAKITAHTKGVIPVHIQGFPCRMDQITEIAARHGIAVIEDACQAVGGSFGGKRLGTIGQTGAMSFNYFKNITCGEGGAFFTDDRILYERALIYHDSSAVAFFGNQMENFETAPFCGSEFRSNELCAAVLKVQLERLDGILVDLRRNKNYVMDALKEECTFIPSHDLSGDCGSTLAFRFESEAKARIFSEAVRGCLPIDTGRHVYTNWEPIVNKRGALHPLMDPFNMEANRGLIPDYSPDACPKTLDLLARTVYVSVKPDDTPRELDEKIARYREGLAAARK